MTIPCSSRFEASLLRADWPAPAGVHAFTTLRGPAGDSSTPFDRFNMGLRSGDAESVVTGNRESLVDGVGLPSPPRWLRQVHGTGVIRFDGDPAGLGEPEADASLTSSAGVVLAVLTADCLPVVFAAQDGSEVAVAHAGWRGLAAGVLEATIAAMHARPERLLAWFGPAAGAQAYEVGEEVRAAFVAHDADATAAFVATSPGHWRVDLYALARQRLVAAGMSASSIHGGGLCTISDSARFYSHRRSTSGGDARTGRMATLAWRQPN